jgi:hypothetical protein
LSDLDLSSKIDYKGVADRLLWGSRQESRILRFVYTKLRGFVCSSPEFDMPSHGLYIVTQVSRVLSELD